MRVSKITEFDWTLQCDDPYATRWPTVTFPSWKDMLIPLPMYFRRESPKFPLAAEFQFLSSAAFLKAKEKRARSTLQEDLCSGKKESSR